MASPSRSSAAIVHSHFLVQYLEKYFVLLDHSKFAARALFHRLKTLLEIAHLRIERGVAYLECPVGLALRPDLPVDLPYPQPAALAQPQWILDERNQGGKREGKQFHAVR